ncbi:MAG: hypothetical protein HOY79_30295 [Streptomyces sp.]|nr:hypothetical protein [Streptomyces sp.]
MVVFIGFNSRFKRTRPPPGSFRAAVPDTGLSSAATAASHPKWAAALRPNAHHRQGRTTADGLGDGPERHRLATGRAAARPAGPSSLRAPGTGNPMNVPHARIHVVHDRL